MIKFDPNTIPISPGIYIYKNSRNEIIYVGKAINLKNRVSQYFHRPDALGPKTQTLVSQIDSIETKIVGSEIEALILESSLIKRYLPKYNSLLKDDRSYIYICISREKLPRVFTAYQSTLPANCDVYGPFPNGSAVKSLLKTIRHIFPYWSLAKHPKTLCLYCHLNLCPGPDPDSVIYRQNIGKIKKLLNGNIKSLSRQLQKEMKQSTMTNNFEKSIILRNQIDSINYVVSGWNQLHSFLDQVNLPEDRHSAAIQELLTTLSPYLTLNSISRIECFDISQMVSRYFVGSMSVWQNGHIDKNEYRKFRINTPQTPDDQFMIKEVIYRRLNHSEWVFPDLIVVDGGKPQVTAALHAISLHQTDVSGMRANIIGLAKKFETIVIRTQTGWREINLPKNSHALRLLQLLRNEAHRFANKYRTELMKKSINNI